MASHIWRAPGVGPGRGEYVYQSWAQYFPIAPGDACTKCTKLPASTLYAVPFKIYFEFDWVMYGWHPLTAMRLRCGVVGDGVPVVCVGGSSIRWHPNEIEMWRRYTSDCYICNGMLSEQSRSWQWFNGRKVVRVLGGRVAATGRYDDVLARFGTARAPAISPALRCVPKMCVHT